MRLHSLRECLIEMWIPVYDYKHIKNMPVKFSRFTVDGRMAFPQ